MARPKKTATEKTTQSNPETEEGKKEPVLDAAETPVAQGKEEQPAASDIDDPVAQSAQEQKESAPAQDKEEHLAASDIDEPVAQSAQDQKESAPAQVDPEEPVVLDGESIDLTVRVKAPHESRWRAGMQFTQEPTDISLPRDGEDHLALINDPILSVEESSFSDGQAHA